MKGVLCVIQRQGAKLADMGRNGQEPEVYAASSLT